MESQITANHEGFKKFLDFCNNALIEDSKPLKIMKLIRKRYKECEENFLDSEEFYQLLVTSHAKILGDRGNFFVYLKEFLNILKENKRTTKKSDNGIKRCLDTDNSSDSDSDLQIKRRRLSCDIRGDSCSEDNDWSKSSKSCPQSFVSGSAVSENLVPHRLLEGSESMTNCEENSEDDREKGFEAKQEYFDKDPVKQTDVNVFSDHKDDKENTTEDASDIHNNIVNVQGEVECQQETNKSLHDKYNDSNVTGLEGYKSSDEEVRNGPNTESELEDSDDKQVKGKPVDIQGLSNDDSRYVQNSDGFDKSKTVSQSQEIWKLSESKENGEIDSDDIHDREENVVIDDILDNETVVSVNVIEEDNRKKRNSVRILEEEFEQATPSVGVDRNSSGKQCSESRDYDMTKKDRILPHLDSDDNEQSSETEMTFKSGNEDKYTSWISKARSKLKTMKDDTDSSNEDRGTSQFHSTHTGKRKYSSSSSSDDNNQYRKDTKQKREKRQKKYKISVGKGSKKDKDKSSPLDYKTRKTSPKDKLSPTKKNDKCKSSPKKNPLFSIHKSPILIVTDSESEEEKPRSLTPLDEGYCEEKRQLFGINSDLKVKIEKIKMDPVGIKDEIPLENCSDFRDEKETNSEQLTKTNESVIEIKEPKYESDHEGVKANLDDESFSISHDTDVITESKIVKRRVALVTEVLFDKNKEEKTKLETLTSNRLEEPLDSKPDKDKENNEGEIINGKLIFPTEQKYPPKKGSEKESSDEEEKSRKQDDDDDNENVTDGSTGKEVTKSRKDDDVQPSTSRESSHTNPKIVKGSAKQVERLEKLLEQIRNKIENVRKRELDLDDLNSNVSDYILEDRLQQKFVKVWRKLCELHNSASSTGRPTEKYFRYQGTRYPDVNRKIEKFVNKKKVFPDYHDVRNIIVKVNKDKKLHLRTKMIDDLAREAFTDVGNQLQRRRKKDFRENIDTQDVSLYSVYDDPALYDTDLKKKLDANKRAAKSNIEKVVDKYARLQYEEGDADDDGDNVDDNEDEAENDEEEEEEEEEDPVESAGNQPTKEIDEDVILLLEEDEEKIESDDEEGKSKQKNETDPKFSFPITKVKKEEQPEKPQTFSDSKSQYFGEMFGLQNTKETPKEQSRAVVKETTEGDLDIMTEPIRTNQESIPVQTVEKDADEPPIITCVTKAPDKSNQGAIPVIKPPVVTGTTKPPTKSHQCALPTINTGVKKTPIDTAAVCKQVTDILTKEFSQGVIEINSDEEDNSKQKPPVQPLPGKPVEKEAVANTSKHKSTVKGTNVNEEPIKSDVNKVNKSTTISESKKKDEELIVIDPDEDEVQIIDYNMAVESEHNPDEYYDYDNYDNQYYDQSYYDNQYYDPKYYHTNSYKGKYKKEKDKDKKTTSTKRTSGWHYETPALNLKITSPRHISVNDHLGKTNSCKSHYNGTKHKANSTFRKGNPEKIKTCASRTIPSTKVVEKIDLTSTDCIEIDLDDNEDKNEAQINRNNAKSVKASVSSSENSSNKEILICDSPKESSEENQTVNVTKDGNEDSVTVIDQDGVKVLCEEDNSVEDVSVIEASGEPATSKEEITGESLVDSSIEVVSVISEKSECSTSKVDEVRESLNENKEQSEVDESDESELEEGEIIYPEDDDDEVDNGGPAKKGVAKSLVLENPELVDSVGEGSNASSDKFVAIPLKIYDDSEQVCDSEDENENEFEGDDPAEYENFDQYDDHALSGESNQEIDSGGHETNSLNVNKENSSEYENEKNELMGYKSEEISEQHIHLDINTNISCDETVKEFNDSQNVEICISKVNMDDISEKNDATSCESNPDIFDEEEFVDSTKSVNVGFDSDDNKIVTDNENSNDLFDDDECGFIDKEKLTNCNVKNKSLYKKNECVDQFTPPNDDSDSNSRCSENLLSGTIIKNVKSCKSSLTNETKIHSNTDLDKTIKSNVEKHENKSTSGSKTHSNPSLEKAENQSAPLISMCSKDRITKQSEQECCLIDEEITASNDTPDSGSTNAMEVIDYSDNEEEHSETIDNVQKAVSILDDDRLDNVDGKATSDLVVSNSGQDEEIVTSTSIGHSSVIKLKQPEVRNNLLKLENAIRKTPTETSRKPANESHSGGSKPSNSLLQVEDKHLDLIESYQERDSYLFKKGDTDISSSVEMVELSDSD